MSTTKKAGLAATLSAIALDNLNLQLGALEKTGNPTILSVRSGFRIVMSWPTGQVVLNLGPAGL